MKTYRAMLAEIDRLQRKAEARRRIEIKGVVKHIRELIAKHGLSGTDLGLDGAKAVAPRQFQDLLTAAPKRGRKPGRPAKAAATAKGVARYRDPATGKTWTGRGKPPNWIVGVKDRTPFEIGAAAPAAPAQAAKPLKAKRGPQAAKKARAAKPGRPAGARKAAAKATQAPKAAKPVKAARKVAKAGAAKKAAPKAAKAAKAPKAVKLPKPPTPKVARKKAAGPKPAPAPAPVEGGNGAAPAPAGQ